jgi:plasmid stabilization system protein ParE
MMRHLYHPAAQAELEAEISFCEAERRGAGAHLRDDILTTLKVVAQFPSVGRAGELGRRIVTQRYHFIIHYELIDDQIVVWAVAHPAREPGYWQTRRSS